MISRVDLHLHSTASDGKFSPSELVAMALERNLLVMAITDHDTTEGIDEALEAAKDASFDRNHGPAVQLGGKELSLLLSASYR